ncbi:hypothetical protein JCM19037_4597 [Geomicrobium sp. JCM 19037]|uniref:head decoration protein n=1 Tax=Geomicrobium sp. JCM 19037 TaxID=1460634 RepID=UPI00045F18B6|nr:head decoration protein [Geomicrobium sp. JCM 19037]GAK06043.1 hypothetical protein JCM19037_4597 [Geomicrobium sp. JCM 19037]
MSNPLVNNLGSFEYTDLISGGRHDGTTEAVTLASGEVYQRGTVIALNDGKGVKLNPSNEDAKPYGIVAEDVDASDDDAPGVLYMNGTFNPDALIFGGNGSAEQYKEALRDIDIFLKSVQG